MQTTPETDALLQALYDQASIVTELDGPQLEAWVSGLFTVFDEQITARDFIDYCAAAETEQGDLLIAALGELTIELDPETASHAKQQPLNKIPAWAATIGTSQLTSAWSVAAKFGTSIVLGFDAVASGVAIEADADAEPSDLRHSVLVELDEHDTLVDLQLAGPAKLLVDEAASADDRVVVSQLSLEEAVTAIVEAWPKEDATSPTYGVGFDANQQFVRRRLVVATGKTLPQVRDAQPQIDIRRGLDDAEFADANRAALSTLQAAIGLPDAAPADAASSQVQAWASVIRGDADQVSGRERDALLWLEWADWLGAGIGLFRAGADSAADGTTLVDHVNRCPEVSSSIEKADREYASWAFDVALDLLQDHGIVSDEGRLSDEGYRSLRPGLVAAWTSSPPAIDETDNDTQEPADA